MLRNSEDMLRRKKKHTFWFLPFNSFSCSFLGFPQHQACLATNSFLVVESTFSWLWHPAKIGHQLGVGSSDGHGPKMFYIHSPLPQTWWNIPFKIPLRSTSISVSGRFCVKFAQNYSGSCEWFGGVAIVSGFVLFFFGYFFVFFQYIFVFCLNLNFIQFN